ncbi:MAG: carbohydrate kinase [Oscillospiraceae bacterium]|nr:carbohydrate kinase [Oscillospiraceae bacterium]
MRYIIAFDVGTTAVKAVCIDRQTGAFHTGKADCLLYMPHPNWVEQDPQQLWDALCSASRECVAKGKIDPHEVGGMVISAPWRNIIPLDENGQPLRFSMIWMDSRGIEQAARLNKAMDCSSFTGQDYFARVLWLKENEPRVWNGAKHIVGLNCYFKYRATGNIATNCSDDFIHTPNPDVQAYYNKVLGHMGLNDEDLAKFPPSLPSTACVGNLLPEAAEALGLAEGIPVFGGFGDLNAIAFGCGCTDDSMTHIYLGTSGWLCETKNGRIDGYGGSYFTLDETHEAALFSLQTGGRAYDWLITQFYGAERKEMGDDVFEFVNKEVGTVPPGSAGLIATHWLNGEIPPLAAKNAKGLFFNVTEQHERKYFARAMLESICYTHRLSLEHYAKLHGEKPENIRVVGGGAMSAEWMQMMADILQIPVRVPANPRYVGTMGTYYCAMIGLGLAKDYQDAIASQSLGEETIYYPNEENFAVYDKSFSVYRKLYQTLKPLYDEINGVY